MGVLVEEKLDMSWLCALTTQKVNHILGYITRSMASRSREEIFPLYSTIIRSHTEYCDQLWGSQQKTTWACKNSLTCENTERIGMV